MSASWPAVRRRGLGDLPIGLTLLAPALAAALVLRVWPMARAVADGVGTEPFGRLLGDPGFVASLKTTLLFGVVVNPLQVAVALGVALLLNERLPAAGLMRTLIFLPVAIPQSVSAVIWSIALRPDGPVNGTLERLGIAPQPFLSSPSQALPSIVLVVSWIGIGYWMTFLVAGLKDVSPALYEAAKLDGAGAWSRFRHITLPSLRRPLAFVLVADTVANFLVFAPVQILTQGGPEGRTDLIMNQIYERAYVTGDPETAAAGTVVLALVLIVVVTVQFRLLAPARVD